MSQVSHQGPEGYRIHEHFLRKSSAVMDASQCVDF